ncbi:MAG TPA: hypothetical protein PLC17_12465 [Tenuifilaceae bacterium]|nr:hypothetical protein [Tenuifilaceae bacterium]
MIYKLPRPNNRLLALLGVALLLLVFSCEQEEMHQPSSQPPGQQQVLNQFFESYKRKSNGFRDKVVERLLAVNDSTGLIFDLASRYGQPNWQVQQASTAKSEPFLVVPVCLGADSVSAVFMFVEQDSSLLLKIFEANSPDTLIADFALHYQCSLFPNKEYSSRKTEPVKQLSKGFETVESCWITMTSINGGKTWTNSYTSCSTKMVYKPTMDIGLGGSGSGGYSEPGGGGGGTTPTNPITPKTPNTTGLSPIAMKKLQKAEENLKNGPCLGKTIYDATWYSGLTINVNPSIDELANLFWGKRLIEFRNSSLITDAHLLHELMHAYQHLQNSTAEHTLTREFEAWLLVDLYLVALGKKDHQLVWSYKLPDEVSEGYYEWIKSIYENGFTTGNSAQASKWIDIFSVMVPNYNDKPRGTNSFPNISKLLNQCKNSQ